MRLKNILKELEDIVNSCPLLMTPMSIRTPSLSIYATASPQGSNKVFNFLNVVISHIINNIF